MISEHCDLYAMSAAEKLQRLFYSMDFGMWLIHHCDWFLLMDLSNYVQSLYKQERIPKSIEKKSVAIFLQASIR